MQQCSVVEVPQSNGEVLPSRQEEITVIAITKRVGVQETGYLADVTFHYTEMRPSCRT